MASPLEGQIAKAVYAGFRGRLLSGTLRRSVNAVSGALDELGDPTDAGPDDYPFEGFRDVYSAHTRGSVGIPDTDSRITILAQSVAVRPKQGDKLWLQSQWWQVRGVPDTDPATATYDCQCFAVPGAAP